MTAKYDVGQSGVSPLEPGMGQSVWPALVLALVLLSITLLISPYFVEKVVSLHRRHGDMRPVVHALQAVFATLCVGSIVGRRWVNSTFYRVFPSTRHLSIATAALLLSLVFALLFAEGAARLFHLPFRPNWTPSENPLARFDAELGWSYIPNQAVTQEFGTEHRKVPMYFDDLGCRVRKPGDQASRSAPTALFVGDSFTFGHGVTYEESFVGRLALRSDFPLQVVNLGVQAYGTDQSLLLLKRQFKNFNTKLVVFTFTSPQVVRNELYDRRVQHPQGLFLGTKPMFALKSDGSLYLARKPVEFKDYSYSHLWAAFKVLELRWGPKPDMRLTKALIQAMKDFVESNGAKFVVVDWYDDEAFPWGLDVTTIRVDTNAPAGWSDWVIPGDTHPDSRAHLYASELLAKELTNIVRNEGPVTKTPSGPKADKSHGLAAQRAVPVKRR